LQCISPNNKNKPMTSSNLSENLSNPPDIKDIPRLKFLTMMRLGLFQMGLGMMAILTLGILNRVMIGELGIPAIVTAGAISMHQFVAPARVWFGQMSDSRPIAGKHRTNYVLMGAIGFTCAVFLAVQVMWRLGGLIEANGGWLWTGETWFWTGALALVFVGYGFALSASSTPFAALLVDVSEEHNRSKVVGVVWSMLMVGIVIGGITGGILLKNIADPAIVTGANIGSLLLTGRQVIPSSLESLKSPINFLFMIMPLGVFGLAFLATWGIEDKYSHYINRSSANSRDDSITLGKAIKVLTASRQTGIFFTFLLVMTLSLFMQEAVLEPYVGKCSRCRSLPLPNSMPFGGWEP
jgi:MFS transporter, BCD family, chlorophyll transporter